MRQVRVVAEGIVHLPILPTKQQREAIALAAVETTLVVGQEVLLRHLTIDHHQVPVHRDHTIDRLLRIADRQVVVVGLVDLITVLLDHQAEVVAVDLLVAVVADHLLDHRDEVVVIKK